MLIGVLLVAFIGAGVGFYLFNKKVPGLEGVTADYTLTADELFDAFDANEGAALTTYENKVVAVNGEVVSVKNQDGRANVILGAANALAGGVNCSFNEEISDLEKGDQVTIKGRCQGFLMDVVLNNCYKE